MGTSKPEAAPDFGHAWLTEQTRNAIMRITNTTAGDITINYRNGVAVTIPAGKYVVRPSSDLDYVDDTKVTLDLFASGALVLANDDGSAWSGSALPSVPASPAGPKPLMVTSSNGGLVVQEGSETRGFVTAEISSGVPTGNFS